MPLDVKVVLIGERRLYDLLVQLDPEFADLFKVEADFEDRWVRTTGNEQKREWTYEMKFCLVKISLWLDKH